MRTICLYFQIHQPFRLTRYRFFDIGNVHYYYDDYANESILRKAVNRSYLHANKVLFSALHEHKGQFKVAFSISGPVLDQFELYAPEVLESFKQLASTGMVEFLCETESHSLASLVSKDEFTRQVNAHRAKIKHYFNQDPVVFRNTELIYSDQIGADVAEMGFEGMITEGAKQILGWKSPNYLYCNALNPRLKLLLRNFKLSDDLSFRFSNRNWSEYPLTTEKYAHWLRSIDKKEENINIFLDYETFGGHQPRESGIFDFLLHFPRTVLKMTDYSFSTPSEVIRNQQPIAQVSVPSPISWADEERDITAWLGNDLQREAFGKLYDLRESINQCNDQKILIDWKYLQSSDHFYYMSTKFFSDRPSYSYVNPYASPYDAFINYMNVLNDFSMRVRRAVESPKPDVNVDELLRLLDEKEALLSQYQAQLEKVTPPIIPPQTAAKTKVSSKKSTVAKKNVKKKGVTQEVSN